VADLLGQVQIDHTPVDVIVVDERHRLPVGRPYHLLAGRGESRREFLNLVRFLGNELRIPLVGVGTREASAARRCCV
jgi:hypothetical protein